MYLCQDQLTIADKILFLHIWDIEASHVGGGHALSEGSQAPPCPEPIREPGQVTVTVKVVGVQTTERDGRGDLLFIRHIAKKKEDNQLFIQKGLQS